MLPGEQLRLRPSARTVRASTLSRDMWMDLPSVTKVCASWANYLLAVLSSMGECVCWVEGMETNCVAMLKVWP